MSADAPLLILLKRFLRANLQPTNLLIALVLFLSLEVYQALTLDELLLSDGRPAPQLRYSSTRFPESIAWSQPQDARWPCKDFLRSTEVSDFIGN